MADFALSRIDTMPVTIACLGDTFSICSSNIYVCAYGSIFWLAIFWLQL